MQDGRTVAVFDFDGTISDRDSTVAFCRAAVPALRLWPAVLRLSPRIAGYRLGLVPNFVAKEELLTALFGGLDEAGLRRRAAEWARDELPRLVRPAALERLRWHQGQGHRTVLATAGLELFLAPWAESVGIDDVLATRLEVAGGVVTGRLDGRNCYGREKVERLEALLGGLGDLEIYAYGDSRGDRELLAIAHHASYRPFR